MNLYIKNMVCSRCVMVVKEVLEKMGLQPLSISLGEVVLREAQLTKEQLKQLEQALLPLGFELIDDRKGKLIEQVKNVVVDLVHYSEPVATKHSVYIAEKLHHDY